MMKALIGSTTITLITAGSAIAGPYAVIENNGGYTGSKSVGSVTDFHIGWEGSNYYAELGPSLFAPDGGETDILLTAKAGGSLPLADKVSGYGELGVTFDKVNSYSTKLGVKYSF
tara:strand:+ start:184 stop:528 length:345 start_codon:yes stop_codon:yes gene_type:complete